MLRSGELVLKDEAVLPGLTALLNEEEEEQSSVQLFSEANKPEGAKPIQVQYFHAITLQRVEPEDVVKDIYTIEKDIRNSSSGELQFDASIRPGAGYTKTNNLIERRKLGLWSRDYLVVIIGGFNDRKSWDYKPCIDKHVKWYRDRGADLALVEPNDGRTNISWISEYMKQVAERDPDHIWFVPTRVADEADEHVDLARDLSPTSEAFPYPRSGWACNTYQYDRFHLTREGLLKWLPSVIAWAKAFSKSRPTAPHSRIIFVTDSTFAGHDWTVPQLASGQPKVTVQTMSGTMSLMLQPSDTALSLKERVAGRDNASALRLLRASRRYELSDESPLSAQGVKEGTLLVLVPRWTVLDREASSAIQRSVNHDMFYIPSAFITGSPVFVEAGFGFDVAVNLNVMGIYDDGDDAWLRETGPPVWIDTYHATALFSGRTMVQHGFDETRGEEGIYSTQNIDVAFRYAAKFEAVTRWPHRWYSIIVHNRVRATTSTQKGLFWISTDADIRPCRLLVRGFDTAESCAESLSVAGSMQQAPESLSLDERRSHVRDLQGIPALNIKQSLRKHAPCSVTQPLAPFDKFQEASRACSEVGSTEVTVVDTDCMVVPQTLNKSHNNAEGRALAAAAVFCAGCGSEDADGWPARYAYWCRRCWNEHHAQNPHSDQQDYRYSWVTKDSIMMTRAELDRLYMQHHMEDGLPVPRRYESLDRVFPAVSHQTKICVVRSCCLEVGVNLWQDDACLLSFASHFPLNFGCYPSQLNSICRRTTLVAALAQAEEADKLMPRWGGYYLPKVLVLWDDNGRELKTPYALAMVHASATHFKSQPEAEYEDTMRLRILNVLRICARHDHKVLILGAWGCGNCGVPSHLSASVFREILLKGEMTGVFERVVFAVLGSEQFDAFHEVLS
eukprot:TRINITY_DN42186_c0_g1_i1.p1 TRINITY_DN42186_c0_g1~~TRINITY_DN42186_c0_g1_i1.p1  ORF type:complete len:902 (+),score=48.39 TRINITY_DN42186_c0_g1_i1:233-2938(+)